MKTPTKIKARKMHVYSYGSSWLKLKAEKTVPENTPVFVLDASRYQDLVDQIARDIPMGKMLLWARREIAKSALCSIGITKGAK